MSGNIFGSMFRVTTFGESHGNAVGVVVDGCPSRMSLTVEDIQKELDRRKPGQSKLTTQRKESDKAEIISGVFEGKTLGTPIAIVVYNKEYRSKDYDNLKDLFRPGTADFTYHNKYSFRDYRGGGRASGRETVSRVAAGAIAKKLLEYRKCTVVAHTKEIYGIKAKTFDESVIEKNPVRCADAKAAVIMEKKVAEISSKGDSVGGIVEIIVKKPPCNVGEPVFDKLDADISKALMSIGAVKGVEIGEGFNVSNLLGSENNDEVYESEEGGLRHRTNHAGGIVGGIANGEDIVIRIAVKPTPSISREQDMCDVFGNEKRVSISGRHDSCICPRIVPVAEAMVAIVLVDHMFRTRIARVEEI